jgi:hypothetical protein
MYSHTPSSCTDSGHGLACCSQSVRETQEMHSTRQECEGQGRKCEADDASLPSLVDLKLVILMPMLQVEKVHEMAANDWKLGKHWQGTDDQ